tara:strand:+ start:62 stop:463 length:402 start_codon:yes stop_codon:yes gene_type:complete
MRLILKILNIFFVILGVIFFCLLVAAYYLYVADPWGIKPILFPTESEKVLEEMVIEPAEEGEVATSSDKHPMLNESQENILEATGVDPASLPTELTPELLNCFEEKLGVERVNEIQNGDVPTITDYFRSRDCL